MITNLFIEGFNIAKLDNQHSGFLMSHQITLWNKDFLLQQLFKKEHPWRNERKATERLKRLNPEIYHIDYFAENGHPGINENINPVSGSAYQTISGNGVLKSNVEPFIKALKKDLNYYDYALQLEYNYKHHLTHDGKPKPKKVDLFKRTKNWLQGK